MYSQEQVDRFCAKIQGLCVNLVITDPSKLNTQDNAERLRVAKHYLDGALRRIEHNKEPE